MRAPRLLVFDSGVGGFSVVAAIRVRMPDAHVSYVADTAAFPYGELDAEALVGRALGVVMAAADRVRPDAIVIACNTASTLVLPPLRARFDIPIVGTVPAIKPAAAITTSGLISVLATPGTVKRDYTHALIDTFASHVEVTLVGAEHLAEQAERRMAGLAVDETVIADDARAAFVTHDGRRTDVVALACTHYPFLKSVLARLAPWPVTWIDPSEAIARRVSDVVGEPDADEEGGGPGDQPCLMTAQPDAQDVMSRALATLASHNGLAAPEHLAIDLGCQSA